MAEPVAHTEVPAETHHIEPAVFGIVTAPVVVALCVFFVILFFIWKKVPAAIARSLDKKIDAIREQLNEAESLRKDAEALKAEYEAKAMAEAKIAAEERAAIDELRATAAKAATAAAAKLIAERNSPDVDKGLVDQAIGRLAK